MLASEFTGEAGKKRLKRVALATKKDVDEAVEGDLGDQSMSGWRRKKPINIKGRYDIISDHEFRVKPNVPGPMVVLEQGRNSGKGRPVPKFTKRGKQTRRSKWNGRTAPKHTWADATALMQQRVGGRVDKEVQKSISKFIKG